MNEENMIEFKGKAYDVTRLSENSIVGLYDHLMNEKTKIEEQIRMYEAQYKELEDIVG